MPEPIREPNRGESILDWARRAARELARLARLLEVDGSNGLEVIGGTLRAVRTREGAPATMRTPSGGIPAMSGTTAGSATCTFYVTNGDSQTLGTATAVVYNDFPTAFDGSRKIKVRWEGGAWRILVQSCS